VPPLRRRGLAGRLLSSWLYERVIGTAVAYPRRSYRPPPYCSRHGYSATARQETVGFVGLMLLVNPLHLTEGSEWLLRLARQILNAVS
jgi:hypothetical protein